MTVAQRSSSAARRSRGQPSLSVQGAAGSSSVSAPRSPHLTSDAPDPAYQTRSRLALLEAEVADQQEQMKALRAELRDSRALADEMQRISTQLRAQLASCATFSSQGSMVPEQTAAGHPAPTVQKGLVLRAQPNIVRNYILIEGEMDADTEAFLYALARNSGDPEWRRAYEQHKYVDDPRLTETFTRYLDAHGIPHAYVASRVLA